jgi:hypothetical protein
MPESTEVTKMKVEILTEIVTMIVFDANPSPSCKCVVCDEKRSIVQALAGIKSLQDKDELAKRSLKLRNAITTSCREVIADKYDEIASDPDGVAELVMNKIHSIMTAKADTDPASSIEEALLKAAKEAGVNPVAVVQMPKGGIN